MSRWADILTVAATLGGLASVARADDGQVSTWVRMDGFSSSRELDNEVGTGSLSLGLKDTYELGSTDRLKFSNEVLVAPRGEHGDHYDFRLNDLLWQHTGSWLDLRVGEQRITWGKADGINPTDFFTPRDYTVLQPMETDQRLSVPAVRADIALAEGLTLSLVAQPFFISSQLPAPVGVPLANRTPDDVSPQAGARLSSSGDNFDWSVSVFHGYVKLPLVGSEIMAGKPAFFYYYPKLDAAGADFAHNFGAFGFRAEAAWLEPHDEAGMTGIRRQAFMVAGIDRGGEDWNVNVQAIGRYTPGGQVAMPTDPLGQMVTTLNNINYGELRSYQLGFTSRLAKSWLQQTLQAEVLAIGYFQPSTFLVRPMASYAFSDASKLSVGGELYMGPDESFFGQFKKNRTAFLEFQRFF
jgi:hypothetical protein